MYFSSTELGMSTTQMPQEGNSPGEWEYLTVREGYEWKMLDLGRPDGAKELLILVGFFGLFIKILT